MERQLFLSSAGRKEVRHSEIRCRITSRRYAGVGSRRLERRSNNAL